MKAVAGQRQVEGGFDAFGALWPEGRLERQHVPFRAAHGGVRGEVAELVPPANQGMHDRSQCLAAFGQFVPLVGFTGNAVFRELAQPRCEQVCADSRELVLQSGVALWPRQQPTDDQKRPALADYVEAECERAILSIAAFGHGLTSIGINYTFLKYYMFLK